MTRGGILGFSSKSTGGPELRRSRGSYEEGMGGDLLGGSVAGTDKKETRFQRGGSEREGRLK